MKIEKQEKSSDHIICLPLLQSELFVCVLCSKSVNMLTKSLLVAGVIIKDLQCECGRR